MSLCHSRKNTRFLLKWHFLVRYNDSTLWARGSALMDLMVRLSFVLIFWLRASRDRISCCHPGQPQTHDEIQALSPPTPPPTQPRECWGYRFALACSLSLQRSFSANREICLSLPWDLQKRWRAEVDSFTLMRYLFYPSAAPRRKESGNCHRRDGCSFAVLMGAWKLPNAALDGDQGSTPRSTSVRLFHLLETWQELCSPLLL